MSWRSSKGVKNEGTIEKKTSEQAASKEWQAERKFRYTGSNFHTIVKRQRNHDTLVNNLLHSKPFTAKQTAHGKTYEPVALKEYERYMFLTKKPVSVFKIGLVVSMASPFLEAPPDGKVIDRGCTVSPQNVILTQNVITLTQNVIKFLTQNVIIFRRKL